MTAADIETPTVIIGASAAGLATAACLKRLGSEHVLLERTASVGAAWRGHYDRLHLHTNKGASHLPFVAFLRSVPRYPNRTEVVDYLERYVEAVGLTPRYHQTVTWVHRVDGGWVTRTGTTTYRSRDVVVATGMTRTPFLPPWSGQTDYAGELLHSSSYRNGQPWFGKRVLVVGFGNSAGEIALDLHEHGARPSLAVRGAVNVVPRELVGIPILLIASVLNLLPPRVADALGAPFSRLAVGDIGALGLRTLPYGPMEQIRGDRHIPLIDVGTVAAIRAGHVAVRGEVAGFTRDGVRFADGTAEPYDAVVAATGYRPASPTSWTPRTPSTPTVCPGPAAARSRRVCTSAGSTSRRSACSTRSASKHARSPGRSTSLLPTRLPSSPSPEQPVS